MPRVVFTSHLTRHVDAPLEHSVDGPDGSTVRGALDAVFARHPVLRGYVVDEQGALRKHVAVFVDAEPIHDRRSLSDAVAGGAEIYVMQALSGGSVA
ncbi:MAG: MoaD/ThiS family protein [Polyangiales bacterium]|nr:MoaD/ThiS family protein [Myxococcales bacterium]